MQLRYIRYFIAVAETGSFTRAAAMAFVTQPTLSAGIAKLEADLGVALFERGARTSRLTVEGQRFLEHARPAVQGLLNARTAVSRPQRRPVVRLAVLTTIPTNLVGIALKALAAAATDVSWRYREGPADSIDAWFAAGRVDLALTRLTKASPGAHRPWFTDRQCLALPARHGLGPVRPEILHGRPLAVRTHCEALLPATRILDRRKVRPSIVHRTTSDAKALELVAAGYGACLMPDSFRRPGVVLEPVEGVALPRSIGFLSRPDGPAAEAMAAIILDEPRFR